MNKIEKFDNFLESLKGKDQDNLIEVIQKGFQSCYEALENRPLKAMFNFKFGNPDFNDKDLNDSLFEILEHNKLLSIASISEGNIAHINTAFYAFNDKLVLFIITDPKSTHSLNFEKNDSVAVSIFDSHLKFWEDNMAGLQLFGKCYRTPLLQLITGTHNYLKRFPLFKELVKKPEDFSKKSVTMKLYTIEIERIKLFDEKRFGEEVFIKLELP